MIEFTAEEKKWFAAATALVGVCRCFGGGKEHNIEGVVHVLQNEYRPHDCDVVTVWWSDLRGHGIDLPVPQHLRGEVLAKELRVLLVGTKDSLAVEEGAHGGQRDSTNRAGDRVQGRGT